MLDDAGRAQRKQIEDARKLLAPSKVDLHEVPKWFHAKLLAYAKSNHMTVYSRARWAASDVLQDIAHRIGDGYFLDHWGSTVLFGVEVFVSEPYLESGWVADAKKFADAIGVELSVHPNSWWYPGQTTRLVFRPKREP